jgi:4-hydroxymandelate oxidase
MDDAPAGNPYLAPVREPDPRLARVVRLADLEPIARDRMHPASFDYVAGGTGDERSLHDAEAAWNEYRLLPRALVDVSSVDLGTRFVGSTAAFPVAVAPMAAHGLAHPDAEVATAAGAAAAGVPFTLSTMSSRSIEEVATAVPDGVRFFQLYVQRDRGLARSLVERAAAAGYSALVLTVDLPVVGYRDRDRRSGFALDVPLGNLPVDREADAPASGYEALGGQRHLGLTWADVGAIRTWSTMPLVLKGILAPGDARLGVEHGADAIIVSSHGARQLDRLPAPADVLAEVVDAVAGRAEVWVDGGIRRGVDVATALALGARGVLVGRPILYALAAGGAPAVRMALEILRDELEIALALLGARTPGELGRASVSRAR